jgi:hypothetical protein
MQEYTDAAMRKRFFARFEEVLEGRTGGGVHARRA